MKMLLILLLLSQAMVLPAEALEIVAPEAPVHVSSIMPDSTDNFSEALSQLLRNVLLSLWPELEKGFSNCRMILASMVLAALLNGFSGPVKRISFLFCTMTLSVSLLDQTQSLILLASDTVQQLSSYGKLLWPTMTTALAAQGGTASSVALYIATAAFDTVLTGFISNYLVPLVYIFLVLSIGNSVSCEGALTGFLDLLKRAVTWCLKTILIIFTTYLSITGVVSGATDTVALKATKVTIASTVPLVGGILSDASEAVVVSASVMKNAAGIYGILAVLALFLEPFLSIGVPYLLLKATAALGGVFAPKEISGLIDHFSTALGMLLAMTGASCALLLISLGCFLKGGSL